jgi:CRISPR-associated protein Cmr1
LEYHFETITPVFGGGARAGFNDDAMPVRWPAVRGNLRFWWRATSGARFTTVEELFEAETALWGSASRRGAVTLSGEVTRPGEAFQALGRGRNTEFPLYALFPFKDNEFRARRGLAFTLRVDCAPELRDEVETAVWAWANFGGLGSRTRRGCGALYCEQLALAAHRPLVSYQQELSRRLPSAGTEPILRGWPTLFRLAIAPAPLPALRAWAGALQPLHEFRQGSVGRNQRPNRATAGRSFWPEADTIRTATKKYGRHRPEIPVRGFPRAEFGLPMQFWFKDSDDPPKSTLYPVREGRAADRMASPLILKPLAVTPTTAVACALILAAPPLREVELRIEGDNGPGRRFQWSAIRNQALMNYQNSPLAERTMSGSALGAFWQFLKREKRWS